MAIRTTYTDNVCILKIEKEVVEIPQSIGIQQGDNMAPVLFLFLMTAFAETLKIVWREKKITILSVMTASNDNLINGENCSHTPAMFTSKTLTAYEILQCLYVDDGIFPFGTVVGHLESYRTHVLLYSTYVLLYSTMVLLARPTKVRR